MISTQDIELNLNSLHQFYTGYFSYYRTLENHDQGVFRARCLEFIEEKNISGAEGFEPNNKVRAIIAASAVQLTLGLETWKLDYFDTIILHPKDFDDRTTGSKFRGETNLRGYIQLSWQSFISGYKIEDDKINLGLHEFTHALRFNSITGSEQDYFVEHYFDAWMAAAKEPFNEIKQNQKTIFRKYGGANINEFLSVCIEHFFESPEEIKTHYPFLYYSTAILLNQCKENGITKTGIRRKFFEEKNKLFSPLNQYDFNTNFMKTSSFKMLMVNSVPLVYTVYATGIASGVSIFLLFLALLFYARYDFRHIKISLRDKKLLLSKGFLFFKNRKKIDILLSQLISLRLNVNDNSECEVIYYDLRNNSFYSETLLTGKSFSNSFLREAMANKIAVFN